MIEFVFRRVVIRHAFLRYFRHPKVRRSLFNYPNRVAAFKLISRITVQCRDCVFCGHKADRSRLCVRFHYCFVRFADCVICLIYRTVRVRFSGLRGGLCFVCRLKCVVSRCDSIVCVLVNLVDCLNYRAFFVGSERGKVAYLLNSVVSRLLCGVGVCIHFVDCANNRGLFVRCKGVKVAYFGLVRIGVCIDFVYRLNKVVLCIGRKFLQCADVIKVRCYLRLQNGVSVVVRLFVLRIIFFRFFANIIQNVSRVYSNRFDLLADNLFHAARFR